MKTIYELKDLQVVEYEFGKDLIDTVMIGVLHAKPEAPANGKYLILISAEEAGAVAKVNVVPEIV